LPPSGQNARRHGPLEPLQALDITEIA